MKLPNQGSIAWELLEIGVVVHQVRLKWVNRSKGPRLTTCPSGLNHGMSPEWVKPLMLCCSLSRLNKIEVKR